MKLGSPQTLAEAGLADHILSTAPNPAVSVQLRSEKVYDALGRAYQQRTNIRQLTRADGSITIDDDDAKPPPASSTPGARSSRRSSPTGRSSR